MTLKFTRYIQAGWKAGVALDFSNGVSVGVTGGGNYGKGRSESEAVRHLPSRIGSTGSRTTLISGSDTTLQGARVYGQSIALDARNLHIESPQDSETHQSRQHNTGAQIIVGYGFSADGNYTQSQLNADHQSVAKQSGIYAGDDGFQVSVNGHTRLNGGLITGTRNAEDTGKNRFVSQTLSHSDIRNHSRYTGESFGLSASMAVSGKTLGQGEHNNPQTSRLSTVADKNGFGKTLGRGQDSDHQSSVTRSGIGTRHIHITAAAAQQAHTGQSPDEAAAAVYTERRSETADTQAGYLNNRFDAERVQNEIDLQTSVSQQFSQTRAQVIGSIDRRLDQLKEQRDNGRLSEDDYQTQSRQWQQGKVLLNMLAAGLASPADNAAGIAAATASPALSYQIGQYFKANDLKNQADGGQRPGESSPAHLLAHSILGAAVAASGGHNALSGALSAGGAEAAAPVLSRWLYGKAAAELTADEKQTVAGISGLLGAGIGAAAGNSSADAVSGSLSARNAVEDNGLIRFRGQYYMDQIKVLSQRNDSASQAELAKLKQAMAAEHLNYSRVLESTCKTANASACRQVLGQMGEALAYYQAEVGKNHRQPEIARLYGVLAQQAARDIAMMQGYLNGSIPTNRIGIYRTPSAPADFRGTGGKNWNNGRFSAGLDAKQPDYVVAQLGVGSIYIPLYGSPLDIYVGSEISKDHRGKSSYGFGVRFGEVITPEDVRLREMGVYRPSTKYYESDRAGVVRSYLDGASISGGGCLAVICGNYIQTVPKGNDQVQHGIEYGIGLGGTSSGFSGGAAARPEDILNNFKEK